MAIRTTLATIISGIERFFDRLKLGYKWRFNRFFKLHVATYRGYGRRGRIWFRGRVLDDESGEPASASASAWTNIAQTLRRIETDEVPGATVRISFCDEEVEATTDEDGYFDVFLKSEDLDSGTVWHEVRVDLVRPAGRGAPVRATGEILIPPDDAQFGVLSDLDDTVIRTGAQNQFQAARVVLLNNARTRTPFAGAATLYRALQSGPEGNAHNPIFYVSSSPWNYYEMFEEFMEHHDIPRGPILLKDMGFGGGKLFKASHQDHKLRRVEEVFGMFADLAFVLVGDSGQKDPEIYRDVVREYPDRVRAILVRDVTPPQRDREVHEIAREVEGLGVRMALVRDSTAAAEFCVSCGLIPKHALQDVERDRVEEERAPRRPGLLRRILG